MATTKKIFEIEFKGTEQQEAKLAKVTVALERNRAATRQLNKTYDDAGKNTGEYQKKLAGLQREQKELSVTKAKLNQTIKTDIQFQKALTGSYNDVSAATRKAKLELNGLDRGLQSNGKRIKELEKFIKQGNTQLREWDQSVGDNRRNVGNYRESLEGLSVVSTNLTSQFSREIQIVTSLAKVTGIAGKEAIVFSRSVFAISNASALASKGLKLLKFAIVSTGIGAVIIGLTSLVAFLTKTQRGIEAVNRLQAGFSAGLDVIIDRLSAVGETIINSVKKIFEDPKQSIEAFATSIRQGLIDRMIGFTKLLPAIGKQIKGFFTRNKDLINEGTEELGAAYQQIITGSETGIEDAYKKIKNGIKGVIKEVKDESKEAAELEQKRADLVRKTFGIELKVLENQKEISELRAKAADKANTTSAERIAFLEKASQLQIDNINLETALANERVSIKAAEIALGETLIEDKEELHELNKAALAAEINGLNRIRTIQSQLSTDRLKRKKEREEELNVVVVDEIAKEEFKATELRRIDDETTKKLLENQNKIKQGNEDLSGERIAKAELVLATTQNVINLAGQAAAVAEQNELKRAGDNEKKREAIKLKYAKRQKARNIIGSVIDTARAAISVLAQQPGGIIPKTIAAGIAIAFGVAQTAIIAAQKLAKGGIIKGASHDQGGVPIMGGRAEVEGGEAIINKHSMRSNDRLTVSGTPKQIASQINSYKGYGVKFQQGGVIPSFNSSSNVVDVTGFGEFVNQAINSIKVVNVATETEAVNISRQRVINEATL